MRSACIVIASLSFAGLAACAAPHERPVEGSEGGAAECGDGLDNDDDGLVDCSDPGCAPSCAPAGGDGDVDSDADADVEPPPGAAVDLLLVVDSSRSMGEEQALLRAATEDLILELLGGGPEGADVEDLHVGVVTTDLGAGGFEISTCEAPDGDEGALRAEGNGRGCEPRYQALDCEEGPCAYLSHSPEMPDDGRDPTSPPIWDDLGCLVGVGTEGCGMEQPLEAMRRALVDQARPGAWNEGFLRDEALLAVLFVTDEDDCSAASPAIFDPDRSDLGPLGLRCALNEDLLQSIDRYVGTLTALKGGDASRVVVGVIGGLPTDASWEPGDPIDALRARVVVDPATPDSLVAVCEGPSGAAFAPVRLVELAYAFGDAAALGSVCEVGWSGIVASFARQVRVALGG